MEEGFGNHIPDVGGVDGDLLAEDAPFESLLSGGEVAVMFDDQELDYDEVDSRSCKRAKVVVG